MMRAAPLKMITGGRIVRSNGRVTEETLLIEGNRIRAISGEVPGSLLINYEDVEVFSAEGCYISPGLIDQHFHGGLGCDFNHSPIQDIHYLMQQLPHYGITGAVPTVITAPQMDMVSAGATLEEVIHLNNPKQCRILGIHMEGPFLSPDFRGAHPLEELRNANLEDVQALTSPNLKIMTLAPELDPDLQLIHFLKQQNVRVSAGHSGADTATLNKAIQAGVCGITHLYNAMRPFHHREPGIIGAALTDDRLHVEIIGDGVHVHPEAIRMAIRSKKGQGVILISDCLALTGMEPGSHFTFGNQQVTHQTTMAVNEEGHLAGSLMFLNDCVKNLVKWHVLEFKDAVMLASQNPAEFLGVGHELGKLEPGYLADFVLWDQKTLDVVSTWIGGEMVHGQINSSPLMNLA